MKQGSELLFEGKIPAEFSIVDSDVTAVKAPIPYYALLSRLSYLSLETKDVVNHFKGSVIEFEQSIWFECNGQPLKSNLPIGVLYDYHSKHVSLPWKLIIHFRKFPGNKLIRASTPSDTEKLFSHALKQSVFLLSGNTRLFTSLSIQKQNDLHQSVAAGDCLLYKDVMEEVTSAVTLSSARSLPIAIVASDGRPVMHRPVRVYKSAEFSSKTASRSKIHPTDESTSTNKEDQEGEDEVQKQCDEEVSARIEEVTSGVESMSLGVECNKEYTTLHDVIVDAFKNTDINHSDIKDILIQGISLPQDAPIFEIWERFCHLDLFLYIVVHI